MSTVLLFFHSPRRSYYARVHIPISIRPYVENRVQCWRSLKTTDHALAKVKAAHWNARLQTLFFTLHTKGTTMTPAEIDQLLQQYFFVTLDDCETDRQERIGGMTDLDIEGQREGCDLALEDLRGALMGGEGLHGQKEDIDALLTAAKLPRLDPMSPAYRRLDRELLKVKQRIYEEEKRRWSGHYSPLLTSSTALPAMVPEAPTKPFSEAIDLYLHEHRTRSPRAQTQVDSSLRLFLRVIGGDRPIGSITKEDCRTYKTALTAKELKAVTINKHLFYVDHVIRWAKAQGYLAEGHSSPVSGLKIAKRIQKKESLKIEAFTATQLQQLLDRPEFQRARTANPERYWVLLLCMFAGLRREEAAQLLVSQVVQDPASGVWYLDITAAGDDQSLKCSASQRRVPVHRTLIEVGFLDYLAQVKASRHARLFYQCKSSARGYGDVLGKWAGRLLRKTLGFPPSLVVHSFRHGFITGLHAAGVPDQLVFTLCGHTASGGEVHAMYTHRGAFPLKRLQEAINRLDLGITVSKS